MLLNSELTQMHIQTSKGSKTKKRKHESECEATWESDQIFNAAKEIKHTIIGEVVREKNQFIYAAQEIDCISEVAQGSDQIVDAVLELEHIIIIIMTIWNTRQGHNDRVRVGQSKRIWGAINEVAQKSDRIFNNAHEIDQIGEVAQEKNQIVEAAQGNDHM